MSEKKKKRDIQGSKIPSPILKYIGLICLICGTILLSLMIWSFVVDLPYLNNGIVTIGEISSSQATDYRPGCMSCLEVHYTYEVLNSDGQNTELSGSQIVAGSIYEEWEENGSIIIEYLASEPETHHIGETSSSWHIYIMSIIFFGTGWLLGVYWFISSFFWQGQEQNIKEVEDNIIKKRLP